MNDPYGNEGLRYTALQNALNGYPMQHQQQQQFFAQHPQMVQPGNSGQQQGQQQPQQQTSSQLRSIVPRREGVFVNGNLRYLTIPQAHPQQHIAVLQNGQIATFGPSNVAYVPGGNGRPMPIVSSAQARQMTAVPYMQSYQNLPPMQMGARTMRISHTMLQQQHQLLQQQHQQFQRQHAKPRQIVQAVREVPAKNNELITLSPTPTPPENQGVEEPMDMPVLDRQDANSQDSATSDSEDETTGYNRNLFLKESEEFNRASGGKVVEHLIDGRAILEADRPFDTRLREFDNFEEALEEIAHRARTGRATTRTGRPVGRPRKMVKEEVKDAQPVQDRRRKREHGRPTAMDKAPENGVKKRRRKIAESEKLKQMDFGPKAGDVIIPDKRLRSERRSTQKEDNTPPAPRRATRRSRQGVDTPVMRDSTEESEVEDELTEMSDYEPAPTEKAKEKRKSAEKITHCIECGEFISRPNYKSPQFCSRKCRVASMTPKKENDLETSTNRSSLGIVNFSNPIAETKNSPPNPVQFEVVPRSGLRIPTTGQKPTRKAKEGEGGNSQIPTNSRLRHSPSAYKVVDLPGCSSKKKESAEKEIIVKEEIVSPKQSPAKMNRPGEPGSRMAQVVEPPLKVRKEDKPNVGSPSRPELSQVVKTEPFELPPNPESWTVEQTCLYTNLIDPSMSEICARYKLDGYVLMHGGDRLDALRKKTFRMNSGSIVPFGPWKKLTKAMGEFANDLKEGRIPPVTFEDCPKDFKQIREWARKITDDRTGQLLYRHEISELEMRSCTVEDLVAFVELSYGAACKVIFVAEKNPEVKESLTTSEEAAHSAYWSCITHAIAHGSWPNREFVNWMAKNFGSELAHRLRHDYVDMDILYSLSTEELVYVYHATFKEAKTIHTYMRDLKERGGTPPNPLEDVYGVTATHLLSGTREERWKKLNEWLAKFIEDDMCSLIHTRGIDSELIFHLSLKELYRYIGIDFCAAKKIVEKCKVIKSLPDYPHDECPKLPEDFMENWKYMTAQDLSSFVKTFCVEGDDKILLAKKIDGTCLPYLTTENLILFGIKFATARHLHIRLEKAKISVKLDPLPPNFLKFGEYQLEAWIVKMTSKETWDKLKPTQIKPHYFNFLKLDALIELGITACNALKILETVAFGKAYREPSIPAGNPIEWKVDDVHHWVSSLTDPEIAEKFRQNSIDGAMIRDISQEEYLTEIEIPWSAYKVIANEFALCIKKH